MFPKLLENEGIYIIEDIETSYWKNCNLYNNNIKSGFKKSNSIINIFKNIINFVNRQYLLPDELEDVKKRIIASNIDISTCELINTITFGHNCIIITKLINDMDTTSQNYRFKHCLH